MFKLYENHSHRVSCINSAGVCIMSLCSDWLSYDFLTQAALIAFKTFIFKFKKKLILRYRNELNDCTVCVCIYLSLYLSVYCVLMLVSPFPPGAQLQVRSLVFLDQQVRLTGFSGGTETERGTDGKMWRKGDESGMRDKGEEKGE